MASLDQLHHSARDIFEHALAAVDPVSAIQRAIKLDGLKLEVCGNVVEIGTRPIYAIAIGKAAASMATGLNEVLGDRLAAGVLSGPATQFDFDRWQTFAGGHPLPNEQSLAAAQATFAILDHANREAAIVIALVSGGGSAMIEWPRSHEITLEELQRTNRLLVNCGASINEINVVRRAFSAVKGGGLARRLPHAKLITLIVSDTNQGDEASVASGPTLDAPGSDRSAIEIVTSYQLETALPETILQAIKSAATKQPINPGFSQVLLDNKTALDAAAHRAQTLGFTATIATEISEQPIDEGCGQLIEKLNSLETPACLISGGEFSCPVRGDGVGGRNLETVVRGAQLLEGISSHVVILSAGTDGIDGNSPAGGAIADETTVARAKSLGLDADDFVERSDSFSFLEKLNATIVTGPTGTNVRDVRILLKARA